MDMNTLAQVIAEEVIKRLKNETDAKTACGNCAVILGETHGAEVDALRQSLEEDYTILSSNDAPEDRQGCRYILPILSCADMAQVATGQAVSPLSQEVLDLLLHGVEVEVFAFEFQKYINTAPEALYGMYESYAETLHAFGLRAFQTKVPDTITLRKTLITAAMVDEMKGTSVLMVPAKAVVTPQAFDVAKELNITIQKSL